MPKRISWLDYYLQIADAVAARADCTRRRVGAVVVKNQSIISTGYNGSPPGKPGCLEDGACPRGRHYKAEKREGEYQYFTGYICGTCKTSWPCALASSPGSSYDTGPGKCIALHAEMNALLRAGTGARGAAMYLTDEPCDGCWKLIEGSGLYHVYWYGGTWHKYQARPWWQFWK